MSRASRDIDSPYDMKPGKAGQLNQDAPDFVPAKKKGGDADGKLDPKQLDLERLLAWLKGDWEDSLGNNVQVDPPNAEEEGTEIIGQAQLSKKDAKAGAKRTSLQVWLDQVNGYVWCGDGMLVKVGFPPTATGEKPLPNSSLNPPSQLFWFRQDQATVSTWTRAKSSTDGDDKNEDGDKAAAFFFEVPPVKFKTPLKPPPPGPQMWRPYAGKGSSTTPLRPPPPRPWTRVQRGVQACTWKCTCM